MNDYSFKNLDFRAPFVRRYTRSRAVHDVKYRARTLDKNDYALDITRRDAMTSVISKKTAAKSAEFG